ncbi:unnamed protein product [Acanthoscelides obtectus]|uniref:Uncharacterized protein n=1 Tax=Acanthoscelides obtectus TaxID=200917 RepID=A0A9P0LKG1_ACAOB|nr:unnamed protein product [Acanthoscelides obtectus]CAK1652421.1 hypothetical protein AOBTE_LOCUS17829 [Acanthoscelides obtectus]
MAVNKTEERDLHQIFTNINRKYEIIQARWEVDSKQYEAKVRTQIPRDNEDFNALCDEWVDLFSEVTDTVWAKKISNTGPKIRFRKQYQCWTHEGKVIQKDLLFDARRCKATLDIKVLTDNPHSSRKNRHVRLGLNVVVKLNFYHLHPVDPTQPFAFFVHKCEPQPDLPKQIIQPNERLPELVAAMVQNAPNISQKAAEKVEMTLMAKLGSTLSQIADKQEESQVRTGQIDSEVISQQINHINPVCETIGDINLYVDTTASAIQQTQFISHGDPLTVEISNIPIESVKLEEQQPQLQQFIVSAPQFDVTEHFLMCQPLVFDTSQVIPLNAENVTSQFVPIITRVDNQNLQNGQIL